MLRSKWLVVMAFCWCIAGQTCWAVPLLAPSSTSYTEEDAIRMWRSAATVLAPVYAPLAQQIVDDFGLAEKEGIGIDLGSGPGNLIIELCNRTQRMHWINADINPYFFPLFFKAAEKAGVGHQVSAIFADAQALPFHDNYADIIVSRGSFHFWEDKRQAFSEIYRVLKPDGVAFIGRGFSANLPVDVARKIRAKQAEKGGVPKYDVAETAAELREIMKALEIDNYKIHIPRPPGSEGVNYGIWIEIRKTEAPESSLKDIQTQDDREEDISYIMEPIEVTGKRWRYPAMELASESPGLEPSITILGRKEIEDQGAKTVIDALEYVPGALVETRGRKVKQFFSVRGQKYPYPEYAVNGSWQREFHETPYFFSSEDIERIEVIRSSAALLTGLSGLAGVVNIVTKQYEEPETSWKVEYGTFDTYRAHLSHGATVGSISYATGLGFHHTDGPEGKNAAEGMMNFYGSTHWQPTGELSIRANLFHIYGKRELRRAVPPADIRFQETFEKYDPFQETFLNVKSKYQNGDTSSTELLLYYTERDNSFVAGDGSTHETTREWDYEWGVNLIQSIAVKENNVLRIGGLYNHWIAPNGKRFYTGKRCDLETFSAVIVDQHHFGRLSLDAGLRWAKTYINDYGAFSIEGSPRGFNNVEALTDEWEPSIFNGNLGAAYYFTRGFSAHFNLAAGHIQPRRGTLDVNLEEPENEMRIKLDVGLRGIYEKYGRASVTGFFTRRKNGIVLSGKTQEVGGLLAELYTNRDQDQVGVEFEAHSNRMFEMGGVFFNATAMVSRVESGGKMARDREHPRFISSGGIYVSRAGLDCNIFGKHVSSYENERFAAGGEAQPLGDFLVLNAVVDWSFGAKLGTKLRLEIINLTDRKFSTVVGYPDFGRRLIFSVRQTLR